METGNITPIQKAINHCGGQIHLARKIETSQQNVFAWKEKGVVPAEVCAAIESATNGLVTRADLRPDIFGRGE